MSAEASTLSVKRQTSSNAASTFDRLFLTEYPKVVAIANRVLNDRSESEDVAQDVFISFHRLHPADAAYAAPWLYAAASHRALNRLRDLRRREQREVKQAREETEQVSDPQLLAEQSEQRRTLRVALPRLREKYANVLVLRYSGLSYSEVAAALHVNVGQVGTLLRRAEAELKKEVQRVSPQ